jgi:hypothetical protein
LSTLATAHPGDPGILFGLLMHHVSLAQGEALFVDAGVVHAYLEGMGLEVMLPSDNVIRAGLTTKYIDRDEFLSVASLEPSSSPPFVVPQEHGDSLLYSGFPAGFRVYKLSQGGSLSLLESHAIVFSDGARGTVSYGLCALKVTNPKPSAVNLRFSRTTGAHQQFLHEDPTRVANLFQKAWNYPTSSGGFHRACPSRCAVSR